MTITIQIPTFLRTYSGESANEFSLDASTVAEALAMLAAHHSALYRSVCDETGALRRHVNLFVNLELVRGGEGLHAELRPGDVLTIMPAVSGG